MGDFTNLKIIHSGERIEIFKVNNYIITSGKAKNETGRRGKEELTKEQKEVNHVNNRKQTLLKARNSIIRLIKCNPDMTKFILLTFAKEHDYKDSKKCLNNCFTKLRRDFPGIKYLWVMEYGDINNRLHFHVLCNIRFNISLADTKEKKSKEHKELENYFSYKYWQYGYVFIRDLKEEGNTNAALYVSVYITKAMQNKELEGYRIYGYSKKTLNKPIEEKYYTTDSLEEILKNYTDYNITFSNSYGIGYTNYKGEHVGSVSYIDMIKENKNENRNINNDSKNRSKD